MIGFVKDKKEMKGEGKDCVVIVNGEERKGKFERDEETGDLRLQMEQGFGEDSEIPQDQLVTIQLRDGSNAEYHGQFNKDGQFNPQT